MTFTNHVVRNGTIVHACVCARVRACMHVRAQVCMHACLFLSLYAYQIGLDMSG